MLGANVAPAKLVPVRLAPFMVEAVRSAPSKFAQMIDAPSKVAALSCASVKLVPSRWAPLNVAPCSSASEKLAFVAFALSKVVPPAVTAPLKFAPSRLALLNVAFVNVVPLKSAPASPCSPSYSHPLRFLPAPGSHSGVIAAASISPLAERAITASGDAATAPADGLPCEADDSVVWSVPVPFARFPVFWSANGDPEDGGIPFPESVAGGCFVAVTSSVAEGSSDGTEDGAFPETSS